MLWSITTAHSEQGDATPPNVLGRDDDHSSRVHRLRGSRVRTHRSTSSVTSTSNGSTIPRLEAVVARVRSRPPIVPSNFTHELEHQKATVEDLVDFDGAEDPYWPVNWSGKKKIIAHGAV
ncbi:hypothetical protein CLCR_00995 [Cladophialophora carrionii]|uniref:Uncharacterized protein n=1 Tax=Cladophialophora carrionii TaxID=86049 RepID=A0A1C1D0M0_9EURO|nr:hypothetical protein CLCR_00995 [Cladophialophora carrionii]